MLQVRCGAALNASLTEGMSTRKRNVEKRGQHEGYHSQKSKAGEEFKRTK
jgi:hypothetical protein